jgi:hypothetical protein
MAIFLTFARSDRRDAYAAIPPFTGNAAPAMNDAPKYSTVRAAIASTSFFDGYIRTDEQAVTTCLFDQLD